MAEQWRQILRRVEAQHKQRTDWEETHPPITLISIKEADSIRTLKDVGQEAVTCDLPCHGNYIPNEYGHSSGIVNVFDKGITIEDFENPPEGITVYFGTTCGLTDGKICIARDEILQDSIKS
jgi:hypothetical protein